MLPPVGRAAVKITDTKTGISALVEQTPQRRAIRAQHDMAMRLLRARIWIARNAQPAADVVYDLPGNVQYPEDLNEYRQETSNASI